MKCAVVPNEKPGSSVQLATVGSAERVVIARMELADQFSGDVLMPRLLFHLHPTGR
jgi:hypothetical protein